MVFSLEEGKERIWNVHYCQAPTNILTYRSSDDSPTESTVYEAHISIELIKLTQWPPKGCKTFRSVQTQGFDYETHTIPNDRRDCGTVCSKPFGVF
jgi:hypothetical protein